ncbi:MAG: NB-ARC domain-containing protein [Caldilinea sp.]|nr:sigma-70 family RNA polymerase sigma factor [Caldilineaceae bacterium]MCB9124259.1 sigma-70 family RNA polymerase sigma factor [Caldilineaceae bacterium]MCO5210288.1 NB-ARC domain-containing protein [Caldilinea sp.]MCW5840886.1 sigma-70 family RNA polymerase sigma factor [Caldilinea sp.]
MSSDLDAETPERLVQSALRRWQDDLGGDGLLESYLVYQQALRHGAIPPRQANAAVLREALDMLARQRPDDAALLEMRFVEDRPVDEVAEHFNFAESTIYLKQNQAIRRLVVALDTLEADTRRRRALLLDERIAVPGSHTFVGIQPLVEALCVQLVADEPPWILSIEGIGGIGKTSLAAAVARQCAAEIHFADFGWVSAKPLMLDPGGGALRALERPALTADAMVGELLVQLAPHESAGLLAFPERALAFLRERLKRAPHLVVVDNLETVADLEALLPTLRALAAPTKFLLTSRKRLIDESGIYLYPMPELSEADALALVRREARQRNLPAVADAPDDTLRRIYAAVGGNPLALLLVVGLTHVHGLDLVLRNLRDARGQSVENLYGFVYRQAWEALDEFHREVLLAMPLASPRGESLAFIASICDRPAPPVADALQWLNELNLVTVSGGLHDRRYGIHSLTRSFLQEQVARWM